MRAALGLLLFLSLAASPATAASHTVQVGDNFFSPATLTIQQGDTVTWTNQGSMAHNVRADDGSFRCANGCDGQGGNGAPSAAAWSFTRTFENPGTKGYHCEAHGAPNSGMAGSIVVTGDGATPDPETIVAFIPIAGSVAGGFGSFFRTSARLFNPSSNETITVRGTFLAAGQDNRSAPAVTVSLAAREVKGFDDVVADLFETSGLGALRFESDRQFRVTARVASTSNCQEPGGGFTGVLLSGADPGKALANGVLLHLDWTAADRANIGFTNPHETETQVTARLFRGPSQIGSPFSTTLPPLGALAPVNIRDAFAVASLNDVNLYVVFAATQPVLAYGTLVDNVTNDPTFTAAEPIPAGTIGPPPRDDY